MRQNNNASSFQFEDYMIVKSVFEIDTDFSPDGDNEVELEFDISSDFYLDNKTALVILECEVFKYSENKPYTLEVDILGKFKLYDDVIGTDLEELCRVNATAILFPYLRAYISNITSLSGVPSLILPTINVHRFIEKSKETKEELSNHHHE